jgi:hypothetical protein
MVERVPHPAHLKILVEVEQEGAHDVGGVLRVLGAFGKHAFERADRDRVTVRQTNRVVM